MNRSPGGNQGSRLVEEPGAAPRRPWWSARSLGRLWIAILVLFGGAAAVLELLGPPASKSVPMAARATGPEGAASPPDAAPEPNLLREPPAPELARPLPPVPAETEAPRLEALAPQSSTAEPVVPAPAGRMAEGASPVPPPPAPVAGLATPAGPEPSLAIPTVLPPLQIGPAASAPRLAPEVTAAVVPPRTAPGAAPAEAPPAVPAPVAAPVPPTPPIPPRVTQAPPLAEATAEPVSAALMQTLLRRGEAMLGQGDISAARRLYERAAAAGSAQGATGVGRTFDPAVLAGFGASASLASREQAIEWYRRGAALGDAEAGRLLQEIIARPGN